MHPAHSPAIDEKLDAILAAVRNCSRTDVWERIQAIDLLIEQRHPADLIRAAELMERLNDRLRTFTGCARAHAYGGARAQLLDAWRHLMRGDYPRAHECLALASACCDDMA